MATPAESAWKKKTGSLFSTLRRRAGKLLFDLAEFRSWVDAEFTARPWCSYCGRVFTGIGPGAAVGIDHKRPLNASYDSSLDNLALCCRTCNTAKGGVMDDGHFRALNATLDICGPAVRRDVTGRLSRSTSVFIGRNRKRKG